MGRAGQQVLRDEDGLADRISVGLLARAFPRATVEAVVEAAKAREKRTRMLPSWLVVYYVLALALFMDMGGGRVMRRLAGTLSWAARGVTVVLPSEEALSRARSRLGPLPLRLLFESVAGPLAGPDTPGGFWRGRRVLSVDGTTLDVQDTAANWARFGGPGTADESGARPTEAGPVRRRVLHIQRCAVHAEHPPSPPKTARGVRASQRARDRLEKQPQGKGAQPAPGPRQRLLRGQHHRDPPSGPRQRPSEPAHHPPAAHVHEQRQRQHVVHDQPRREHPCPFLPCLGRLNDRLDRCPRERPRQQPYRDPVRETVLVPQYLLSCSTHAPKLHPCNLKLKVLGATAVQLIPEIAPKLTELTV